MGREQQARGLDRLPLGRSGRIGEVYRSGKPHLDGRVDEDPRELREVVEGLGVRSQVLVPLALAEGQRGVLGVMSAEPEQYSQGDVRFMEAVARWLGLVATDRAVSGASSASRQQPAG
jgi:GAF domain-containing protein